MHMRWRLETQHHPNGHTPAVAVGEDGIAAKCVCVCVCVSDQTQ